MKTPVTTHEPITRESYFYIQEGNVTGVVFRSFLPEETDWVAFLADLDENPGEILRKGGGQGITSRRTVTGREVYVKRYLPSRFFRRLRDWAGRLRVMAEWQANLKAESIGIRTGTVAAAISVRKGMETRHYFISYPCQGTCVSHLLKSHEPGSPERERLLDALARYIAVLHHKGFFHAHLHLAHVFADENLDFGLIDLEASRIYRRLRRTLRMRNLSQIQKNLRKELSTPELKHFRRQYRQARGVMKASPASATFTSRTSTEAHTLSQRER